MVVDTENLLNFMENNGNVYNSYIFIAKLDNDYVYKDENNKIEILERFIIDIGGTVLISRFNDGTNIKDLEINVPEKEEDNKGNNDSDNKNNNESNNNDNNNNDSNEGNNNNDSNNNNGKNTKKNNKNDNNLNDGKQVLVLPNKLLIILILIYILN
jgi:hypothetical protein